MKKENKKLAQERRAKERKKAAITHKMANGIGVLIILVVVALVIGIFALIVLDPALPSNTETSTDKTSETTTEATGTVLNTETGVVVEEGDTINLDYTGYVDGVEFSGGSTQGYGTDLTLGSGSYIDGFEDAVIGHEVGETFDIEVTFPENYQNVDLAGQDATFTITINGVYE